MTSTCICFCFYLMNSYDTSPSLKQLYKVYNRHRHPRSLQLRLGLNRLVPMPPLRKVRPHLVPRHVHRRRVLDRARHRHRPRKLAVHRILRQLAQHPPQRLARARLGDHALALDDAAERGNGADLLAHQRLDLGRQLVGGDGRRGMVAGGERDKGKGQLALEGVGDADDAALGDEGMGRYGLLDAACFVSFM